MMKTVVFLCTFSVFGSGVAQAESKENSLSLNEMIQIAMESSPLLKAQDFEVKARESLVGNAGAWSNPELSVETERKEDASSRETKSLKYGLSQKLSMPGRFSARRDMAMADANVEKTNFTDLEIKTKVAVTGLAYEYATDIEKAKHAEERLKRFQSVHSYIRSRTFASPQKKSEAGIVSAKLLVLQKELEKLKSEVAVTWNRLNFYLDLPTEVNAKLAWFKNPVQLVESELLLHAEQESPEWNRLRLLMEREKSELRLANRESWPELTLNGAISNGSGADPEKIYTLGVSLPIPVFNANRSVVRAQDFKVQASHARLNAHRANLKKYLNSAFVRYLTTKKSISNLQISKVSEIERNFSQTEAGFKRGLVDLLTFLEADSQHAETISAIYDTQVEYVDSLGELSILAGRFLFPSEQ